MMVLAGGAGVRAHLVHPAGQQDRDHTMRYLNDLRPVIAALFL